MCGIAGVFHLDGIPVDINLIRRMVDSLAHRGPDGEGVYLSGPIALGHRRLAVIDLSLAAKQPMANEDGSIWITYNGEIYNFKEIRHELVKKGHVFSSDSDTEVVIHAYEEWGTACLGRFNGMFAFGLWDEHKKHLWLVRDRLGVKPLFYCQLPRCLLFGSEIKAIICDDRVSRAINCEALAYYLALNYVPAPYTLFTGIRQILPGHYLLVDAAGQVQDVAYWDVVYREDEDRGKSAYIEEFNHLFEDSIRLRLISDVPFGVFLSGGVDSSSVAYWMSRHLDEPLKTFSVGFGEASYDELEYARLVAQSLKAVHHEQIVKADISAVLPKLVWHAEEPTADSSMVAVYYLAQRARQNVTMVLSGDGADELLAGYETYQAYYVHRLYTALPTWLRYRIADLLVNTLSISDAKVSWDTKIRRFLAGGDLSSEDAHAIWRIIFDQDARMNLLAPILDQQDVKANIVDLYRAVFAQTNARHPINRLLYADTRFYLPNDMLVKVDRMTMAHGLEAREPFLDYRLVEYIASVPPRLKLNNFYTKKYLLKVAMRGKLPSAILRRGKQGFNVPNARWIKQELKPIVMDLLSPQRINEIGFLEAGAVNILLQEHFEGRAENSHKIWNLIILVLWWELFINKRSLL